MSPCRYWLFSDLTSSVVGAILFGMHPPKYKFSFVCYFQSDQLNHQAVADSATAQWYWAAPPSEPVHTSTADVFMVFWRVIPSPAQSLCVRTRYVTLVNAVQIAQMKRKMFRRYNNMYWYTYDARNLKPASCRCLKFSFHDAENVCLS